ncbi:hypothetical protein VP01_253g12 [Puccinia sorghi]|uniref:Lysophospholipase n=1 Tax=Puccinia sorghi TaxID=27349 RepID=A0A0L6V5Y8_9BASI|nr:hypothetical protein VP01_253g12 [Puccinia sorghi]
MRCRSWQVLVTVLLGACINYDCVSAAFSLPRPRFNKIFDRRRLFKRDEAIPTAPSGGYAPSRRPCPEKVLVRQPSVAGPLNPGEAKYVLSKAQKSLPLWRTYLENAGLLGFNIDEFLSAAAQKGGTPAVTLPNFGFALSGGGARAGLVGAGILNAFDSNNPAAVEAKTGGILQLANYAAGLSGASWVLGSWATANFPSFTSLNQTVWKLTQPDAIYDIAILKQIHRDLKTASQKAMAGFPISIVDNTTHHANAVLLSSVKDLPGFKSRYAPFATSSNIFSTSEKTTDEPLWAALIHKMMNAMTGNVYDEAIIPNPFQGLGLGFGLDGGYPSKDDANLYLADSSLSGETLPLWPLIQPSRNLDAIITVDSSNRAKPSVKSRVYPNGTSLYASYRKILPPDYAAYHFPKYAKKLVHIRYSSSDLGAPATNFLSCRVPDPYGGNFSRLGYNKRPVFFGCDQNSSLIIYLPNHFIVAPTDAPTAQMQYSNGFALATQTRASSTSMSDDMQGLFDRAGPSSSIEWSICLACALIDKQQQRNAKKRTAQCQSCFDMYCAVA